MKTLLICSTFVLLFFMSSCSSLKTTTETTREITQKVESKDFTVDVNFANTQRGRQIYLAGGYDLRIKNDSAFAYLPYYGVAYVAPYNSTEGGIKFAEPMMEYSMVPNKKSTGWDIRFKIKSNGYLYEIFMDIFNNGSTQFTVSSYQRDMITFRGEVQRSLTYTREMIK
jgi:hypothetical protein